MILREGMSRKIDCKNIMSVVAPSTSVKYRWMLIEVREAEEKHCANALGANHIVRIIVKILINYIFFSRL